MKIRAIVAFVICVLVIVLAIIVAVLIRRIQDPIVMPVAGAAEDSADDSEDDLDCTRNPDDGMKGVRETPYSTLLPHQAKEVELALKKHFTVAPQHIIDATAHVGGDTINFMRMYPKAAITAVEVKPDTFRALVANVRRAEQNQKDSQRPQGAIKLVNNDCITFLQATNEKADFVYLDPPWGGKGYRNLKTMSLYLIDAKGKKWDIAAVVELVFDRNIAPCVVLKAPFNFRTAEFSSHLNVPLTVHPIGRSKSRHSSVSYWLLVAGKCDLRGKY